MTKFRLLLLLFLIALPASVYSQEVNLDEIKAQRTRQLCVYFLDGYLCLSQEQHIAMEEELKRIWTKRMTKKGRMLLWAGYGTATDVFGLIDVTALGEILTDDQIRQFESLEEHGLSQSDRFSQLLDGKEIEVDPIKPTLTLAVELELQRTKKLLDLDAKQVRMLRVAAKGAAENVLNERQKLKDTSQPFQAPFVGNHRVRVAVEGPAFRIRESDLWNRTLNKVLSDEQLAILIEDQTAQAKVSASICAHSLAMAYFNDIKASKDEYVNFLSLVEGEIAKAQEAGKVSQHGAVAFHAVEVLIDIDDEQFMQAVTTETWDLMKPKVDRVRAIRDNNQDDN